MTSPSWPNRWTRGDRNACNTLSRETNLLGGRRESGGLRYLALERLETVPRDRYGFFMAGSLRRQFAQLSLDTLRIFDNLLKPLLFAPRVVQPVGRRLETGCLWPSSFAPLSV